MAVPKRKTSPSRRGNRRSHDKLKALNISVSETGEPKLPHHISMSEGTYKGRQVFVTRAMKKAQKAEAALEAAEAADNA
jgi:large subunit ribosomal protein L32